MGKSIADAIKTDDKNVGDTPKVESFFKLPEGLAVTSEQVAIMNNVGKGWQSNVTKAIQRHTDEVKRLQGELEEVRRQAVLNEHSAKAWEDLTNDPQFLDFYKRFESGELNTPVTPTPDSQNDLYNEIEDGATLRAFKKDLLSDITAGVKQLLNQELAPVRSMIGQTREEADRVYLKNYAKQVNGPDPNDDMVSRRISTFRKQYPNMPIADAYDLVRSKIGDYKLQGNSVQEDVSIVSQIGDGGGKVDDTKAPVTIPPSGGAAVIENPFGGKSPLEIAREKRAKGDTRTESVFGHIKNVFDDFKRRTGVDASIDDLSR